MYAVIKTGGKQYRVREGDEILVEKLSADAGQKVRIEDVLMVKDDSGVYLGKDLKGAYVEAEVLGIEKGEKIIVFKYRAKKRYRRKTGHRQNYTRIKILKINYPAAKESSPSSSEGREESAAS